VNMRQGWKGARYHKDGITQEAKKVFSIEVENTELNKEYELEIPSETTINNQGLLLISKLKPKQSSLPVFNIRWDEKGKHLNIDMISEGESITDWDAETNGYKGHRPDVVNKGDGLAFAIEVKTPRLDIFKGVISFKISRNTTISPKTLRLELKTFPPEIIIRPPSKIKNLNHWTAEGRVTPIF
jgi:hypothetical protein